MSPQNTVLNDWADFWFNEIGANVIWADTKNKQTFETWSEVCDKPISKQVHEDRKNSGYYNRGIAVVTGQLWRGPYAGNYLVAIDLDNPKAIEEFCRNGLEDLKQRTLVEQSANTDKMHVYFIVEREIPNKASDKVDVTKSTKIQANEIPALEVKSKNGIMFCAYSPHENGSNYRIIGTLKPEVFPAQDIENRIGGICDKFGIPYGSNNNNSTNYNNNSDIGPSIQELFSPGTKILEGHNRHLGILRVMDSLLIRNMGLLKLEQIRELANQRNQELCDPPLDDREMDGQWKQSLEWANRKKQEREKAKQKQDQQDQPNNNNNKNTIAKTKLEKIDLIEEAVRLLMSKYRFATIIENKEILYYDEKKGVYVKDAEILIDKEVDKTFGFDLHSSPIGEIKNFIRRKTWKKLEEFDSNIEIINLKNGLYNWKTDIFSLHTPDYYSLNQIPVNYDKNARPKLFLKFLREVLYLQDIRTAVELIAYTFVRRNIFEYYFILIGIGANGKSVFVGILTHLHGKKNTSNVALKSIGDDRFALFDMVGKDVNVDTELSNANIKDISNLKKLTGIQPIRVQQKGQPAFDAEIHAKQVFNTNELPNIPDTTDARYRREIILYFYRQFEGENQDLNLLNKIVNNEEEMSGIFNLAVNSLRTITKNNSIHVNAATIKERRAKAKLTQNPIKAFLDDALSKEPREDDYETWKDMYDAFHRFCTHHKLHILSEDDFSEKLGKYYTHIIEKGRKMIDKRKVTIWKCKLVKWKNSEDPSQTTLEEDADNDNDDCEQPAKEETKEEKYARKQEEIAKW
jgi:P4 family phage/plasmid primase-like protien